MNKLSIALGAIALSSLSPAFADETTEKTQTNQTDGKKTTHTRKVKHTADAKGNSEVKTETVQKTELTTPNGKGGSTNVTTETHDTDGKSTKRVHKVKHSADAKGDAVTTETTHKTTD